jgi:hypothetical protein
VNLDTILWFSSCVVEAALVGLLLYRRAWRAFPLFLSYNAWSLIGSLAAVVVLDKYRSSYTTWYLVETILDSTLLFGVLIELAWSILRPVRASLSRRALIPLIGLILALGAAVWPFASLSGVAGASGESYLIAHLLQTVSILQIIFFFVLIASSQLLSIGWRDRELQVATGLGLFSLASIATAMLQMHQTSFIQYRHLVRIEIGGYICSLVYWIVCFVQQEAARREFTPQMRGFLLAAAGAARSNRVALTESQMVKPRKGDQ